MPIVFLCVLAAAITVMYHGAIEHMVAKWTTPDGSHGPLILGVSLYLLWIARDEILHAGADPALIPGSMLLFVGCFMYFAGVLSSTMLVQMISMVPVLLGVVWLFGGDTFFRIFLLPVGYLLFLTGLVEQLLGGFAIYFQQFAAISSAFFFKLIGIPVYQYYTIVELPHISLQVVRACSGIGHIVALFALAIPLAYLFQRTWPRKVILVVLAFIIGLVANSLRIVMIGLFTMFFPDAGVHGPYEIFQVSVIFFLGIVVLILFSSLLSRTGSPKNISSPEGATFDSDRGQTASKKSGQNSSAWKQRAPFIIGIVIFTLTLGFAHFYTPRSVALKTPLKNFPDHIAGFSGKDLDRIDKRYRPFPADNELLRTYENHNAEKADIYIGYFKKQDRTRKIIDYRREWMHLEATKVTVANDEKDFVINRTRQRNLPDPVNVYFWYSMHGRMITNQYAGKLLTFLNAMFTRSNNAAVVVIATRSEEDAIMPLITGLVEAVQEHLDQ